MIPKKLVLDLIGDGNRFSAFAKPASAGEGRSEKIMLKQTSLPQAAVFALRAVAGGLSAGS